MTVVGYVCVLARVWLWLWVCFRTIHLPPPPPSPRCGVDTVPVNTLVAQDLSRPDLWDASTALHDAVVGGLADAVQPLVDRGCDLEVRGFQNKGGGRRGNGGGFGFSPSSPLGSILLRS